MRSFALAFVAGAWWLQQQPELPVVRVGLAGAALLLAAALVPDERRWARVVLLAVAGGLGGYGWAAWRADVRLADALQAHLEGRDIAVRGIVAGLPQRDARRVRFIFHVEQAARPVPPIVRLSWHTSGGARSVAVPALAAGERWQLTVRLRRPRGGANPHGFDFEPWALERGIRATGYVRADAPAHRLAAHVPGWPQSLHRWRGKVRDDMRAQLGGARLGGVLVALAIGEQDEIAPADWDVFWRTGVGHLMSISGLHITMLAALAFAMTRLAWSRVAFLALAWPARRAAVLAGALVALAYCLATGYAIPAQRTFLMLAMVALCVLVNRHGSPSRVLALAATAVVAADPWAAISPGFWLSFGAVAAIFYALGSRTGTTGRVRAAIVEQLAVTVVMVPLLLALFQEVSLVSPLANALAIPLVSLGVVPLTLAGAFLPLPALLDAAHALMQFVMAALEAMAAWPVAMAEAPAPAPWMLAASLVGCAWLLAPRGVPLRSCGLVWIAPLALAGPPRPPPGAAWLDLLDVGNGLAVVIRTARHALVYDTGPTWNANTDSGERVVVPFLRGEGIARLDALVVSHADDDHAGGAISVARSRRPPWLLSSLSDHHPVHALVERSDPCEAGRRWRWDGVEFTVLHPGPRPPRSENDRSCVLRVATAGAAALLTGDIEKRGEAQLLARPGVRLAAEVLVVPHHGSRTSSSAAFLDAVNPSIALVSVAHRSRFGHPHASVVRRYGERGIALRRTDLEGALHVTLPAQPQETIAVTGYAHRVRYWSDRRRFP